MAGLAAVTALAAAALLAMAWSRPPVASAPSGPVLVTVTPRPLVERLSLVGTIEPGGIVNVVAPFDGAIKEKLVEFGTRVEKGQVLLALDTSEIELQLHEAEAAVIKAERAMKELRAWGNTPEVVRARNAVTSAQMRLDDLSRKEQDSKALLARGIIPRMEHEAVTEQLKAQRLQWDGASQELDSALKRGDAEHRRLAELELETARKRQVDLKRRMDAGIVEAPVSGLLLRPVSSSESKGANAATDVAVGSRAGKGQPMFTIADTASLKVVARVDEIDVNRIAEGMPVEVTGDAFGTTPLAGRVVRLSAQAAVSSEASRSATFELVAALSPLPEDMRSRVRVGMSASLSIVTYRNDAALVVPPAAIRGGPTGTFAVIREAGQDRAAAVLLGHTTEHGVEILQGLKGGDVVVVENAP